MDEATQRKMELLKRLMKADYQYMKLERKLLWLELEFSDMVNELSEEQQNLAWDYVLSLAELDRRLLGFACHYIDMERLEFWKHLPDVQPQNNSSNEGEGL